MMSVGEQTLVKMSILRPLQMETSHLQLSIRAIKEIMIKPYTYNTCGLTEIDF